MMHEPPEIAYETVSSEVLLQRLEMLRERLRTGVMSVGDFNAAIKAFQFRDEIGHLWAPGATSGQWYRWDDGKWTPAQAPARLQVDQSPIMFDDFEEATTRQPVTSQQPAQPAGVVCPNCGARNIGKKFCTSCGTKLVK